MFDSGITVKQIISQIRDEADIAYPIGDKVYIRWINSIEQLLYSEIIQQQCEYKENIMMPKRSITLPKSDISGAEPFRFEDIVTVYANDVQLIKTNLASGVIFENSYFNNNGNLEFNLMDSDADIRVIYNIRPKIKTDDTQNIMLPIEFIDLVTSKLRGEAYKIANEDSLAAKWINDYNVLLETFKNWVAQRQASFGI